MTVDCFRWNNDSGFIKCFGVCWFGERKRRGRRGCRRQKGVNKSEEEEEEGPEGGDGVKHGHHRGGCGGPSSLVQP